MPTHLPHRSPISFTKIALTSSLVGLLTLAPGSFLSQSQVLAQDSVGQPTQLIAPNAPTPATTDPLAATATPTLTQTPPATSLTLTAIPPRLGDNGELKVKPGETLQTTLRIRNSSEQAVPISTIVQDFVIGEDGSTPVPVDGVVSNRWSLASWVTLSSDVKSLRPGQTGNVSVVISVPADALPGGHYAMVMHEPNALGPDGAGGAASRVAQRVGTLLYVTVDGPINESAFIRDWELPKLREFGPVPYSFVVENVSDIHIKPQIGMEIFNVFGQKVDTIGIDSKNIFPYTSRSFEGQWDRVWGIGPYKAKLTMSYGQQGSVVVASQEFWLIPLKLVLAIITMILTGLAAIILIKRHLDHRFSDDKQRIAELEQKVQDLTTPTSSKE